MKIGMSWLLFLILAIAVCGIAVVPVSGQTTGGTDGSAVVSRDVSKGRVLLSPAIENVFWHVMRILRCIFWMTIVCHILMAFLVAFDIRKRGEGSMLFVLLTLLGGVFVFIAYGVFRLGDKKAL